MKKQQDGIHFSVFLYDIHSGINYNLNVCVGLAAENVTPASGEFALIWLTYVKKKKKSISPVIINNTEIERSTITVNTGRILLPQLVMFYMAEIGLHLFAINIPENLKVIPTSPPPSKKQTTTKPLSLPVDYNFSYS